MAALNTTSYFKTFFYSHYVSLIAHQAVFLATVCRPHISSNHTIRSLNKAYLKFPLRFGFQNTFGACARRRKQRHLAVISVVKPRGLRAQSSPQKTAPTPPEKNPQQSGLKPKQCGSDSGLSCRVSELPGRQAG